MNGQENKEKKGKREREKFRKIYSFELHNGFDFSQTRHNNVLHLRPQ